MAKNPLAGFDIEQLYSEINRRRALEDREPIPIEPCDECRHFKAFTGEGEPPKNWKCCALGHRQAFRAPTGDFGSNDWGFFRRNCKDRDPV